MFLPCFAQAIVAFLFARPTCQGFPEILQKLDMPASLFILTEALHLQQFKSLTEQEGCKLEQAFFAHFLNKQDTSNYQQIIIC